MAKETKTDNRSKKSIFTLDESNRKKLKIVAVLQERDMQDIVNEALSEWITRYEKKNGAIPVK
jgi:hypothetical protein